MVHYGGRVSGATLNANVVNLASECKKETETASERIDLLFNHFFIHQHHQQRQPQEATG